MSEAIDKLNDELWSFLCKVLSQGGAIQQDYNAGHYPSYEHYSARLDEAARERADQLAPLIAAAIKQAECRVQNNQVACVSCHQPVQVTALNAIRCDDCGPTPLQERAIKQGEARGLERAIRAGESAAFELALTQTGDEQLAVRMILEAIRAELLAQERER